MSHCDGTMMESLNVLPTCAITVAGTGFQGFELPSQKPEGDQRPESGR